MIERLGASELEEVSDVRIAVTYNVKPFTGEEQRDPNDTWHTQIASPLSTTEPNVCKTG